MFKKFLTASMFAAAMLAAPASAGIINADSVTASNTFPFWNDYKAVNLINGSGLTDGLHDGAYTNMWMTDQGVQSAVLVFDLGSTRQLSAINVWNYNADFGMGYSLVRSARAFAVSLSNDGLTYEPTVAGILDMGTGLALAAQTFTLEGTARYVRLDLLSNYGDIYSAVGLSEVSFAEVPEPAALGLLGIGILGIAAARRRRV